MTESVWSAFCMESVDKDMCCLKIVYTISIMDNVQ